MPPDWDALWVTAASITSAPARAKTSPRAIVPVTPSSSTTRRILALIGAVRRNFMNFLRRPSTTRTRPQMTMISPAKPTSQRPAVCCMAVAVMSCSTTRLAAVRAGDHRERQVRQARVDDRPGQRLEPGAGPGRLASNAERGLAQPPQRVAREADAKQPERDLPVGFAREQVQGALLVRLARAVPQCDQRRDPADQDVDDTARGQARTSQEVCRRAAGGPPCGVLYVRRRYRVHTRHYLVSRSANVARMQGHLERMPSAPPSRRAGPAGQ